MSAEEKDVPYWAIGYGEKMRQWMNPSRVVGIIIGLGIVLRLIQYLHNRSLWLDEASLAFEPDRKNLFRIITTPGLWPNGSSWFSLAYKVLINTFGDSEFVLRLFPFVAGSSLCSFFMQWPDGYLSQRGLIIALALLRFQTRYSATRQNSSNIRQM